MRSRWLIVVLSLACAGLEASAGEDPNTESKKGAQWCDWLKESGGEVPIPFQRLNQKVQLADEEYYVLHGEVKRDGFFHYLVLNEKDYSWLSKRNQPELRYPLIGSLDVEPFSDRPVRMIVQAQAYGARTYVKPLVVLELND